MEGFQFQKRPMITICGKEYECDPTNTDLIEGMMRDFPRIAVLSEKLQSLKEKMLTATENYNAKEVEKYTQQAFRLNKELLEACRDFNFGTVGEKEYQEIFSGRKPNSVDHIQLCTYIFRYITEGRLQVLQPYLDPPEVNPDAVPKIT